MKRKQRQSKVIAMLVLLVLATTYAPSTTQQVAAAVREPYLSSVTVWRDGSNIYADYCGAANSHSLSWGQDWPRPDWRADKEYGAIYEGYCWHAYLFADVEGDINERLWISIGVRGTENRGAYVVTFYPKGDHALTTQAEPCKVRYVDPWLENSLELTQSNETTCFFTRVPQW